MPSFILLYYNDPKFNETIWMMARNIKYITIFIVIILLAGILVYFYRRGPLRYLFLSEAEKAKIAEQAKLMGDRLMDQSRWKEAERAYLIAVRLQPGNLDYLSALGHTYYERSMVKKAYSIFKKNLELHPDSPLAHQDMGWILSVLHRYVEAEREMKKAIELKPDYIRAHNLLGAVYRFGFKNYKDAMKHYNICLKLNPLYQPTHLEIAELFYEQRNYDKAIAKLKWIEKTFKDTLDERVYIVLGEIYRDMNKFELAEKMLTKAHLMDPANLDYHVEISDVYREMGNYDKARKHANKVFKIWKTSEDAELAMAFILLAEKKYPEAEKYLREMARHEIYDEDLFVGLGHACLAQNKIKDAERFFLKSLNLKPDYEDAYVGLGLVYLAQDLTNEARKCFQKAAQVDPYCEEAWLGLGDLYTKQKKFARAEQAYNKALSLRPSGYERAYSYWRDWGVSVPLPSTGPASN
ncbi:MAG: tetratricopeptide repeat protein [Candidatus Eremiobacteraeota bacterium]|nr:tetratricopeptide repeat protein [Candidatus Eremiobacteraeota bacterium]